MIKDSAMTTFYEELSYCDGSDSDIISQLYCEIPLTVLRASPFILTLGQPVIATVQAKNERGWGSTSAESTTNALMQTEPS